MNSLLKGFFVFCPWEYCLVRVSELVAIIPAQPMALALHRELKSGLAGTTSPTGSVHPRNMYQRPIGKILIVN